MFYPVRLVWEKAIVSRVQKRQNAVFGLLAAFGAVLTLGMPVAQAQMSFTDVTDAAGVTHLGESFGASWGDLNGDGYPDIYVSNHRTRDSLLLNKGDGTFFDTGAQVLTWINHVRGDTHGGSFVDFDNDGDQDLLVSTGSGNPNQFLVNERNTLLDRTVAYGITLTNVAGRLPVWVDYNGDRLPDFIMANRAGNAKVYKQNASGTGFTETTGSTQSECDGVQYGQLYDVNDDGRLDFVCSDDAVYPQTVYNTLPLPWQLLFDSGAPNSLFPLVKSVADSVVGDFNNDGRLDVFLLSGVQTRPSSVALGTTNNIEAQLAGGNKGFKFISTGAVTFTIDWNQADEGSPVSLSKIKIGASGWSPTALPFTLDPSDPTIAGMPPGAAAQTDLPLMQIGYDSVTSRWTLILQTKLTSTSTGVFSEAYLQLSSAAAITQLQSTGLWASDKAASPTLLMNYSSGYTDNTAAAGLSAPVQCGSVTTGDFDNDMDLDLYLACRTGASNIQNILYENQGNGTFVAVPNAGGAAGPVGLAVADGVGTADSVVSADYDVDGFLDLFVTNGLNLRPLYYGGPNKLFHNQGNTNHWVEVELVGTNSAKDAIGARIKATANSVTQLRVVNDGYHRWSQEHTPSHFGLAAATVVDLRVEWPSGTVQTFTSVAMDKLYRITEGGGITAVALGVAPPYPCGSPSFNGAVDVAVFVWKDCTSGGWRLRTTSGGTTINYSGTLTSSSNYTSVTPQGLESNDVVDSSSNPKQVAFQFVTTGNGSDGVNVTALYGVPNCLKLAAPAGAQIFYGPLRVPVSNNIDLETLASCAG